MFLYRDEHKNSRICPECKAIRRRRGQDSKKETIEKNGYEHLSTLKKIAKDLNRT